MNHDKAAQTATAERYLLGELTPNEAGEFEEHYFDCKACAEDVRLLGAFLANTKAVLEDKRETEQQQAFQRATEVKWWRRFVPVPALATAAAFACSTFYLALVKIPGLESQYEYAYAMTGVDSGVLRAETRGDETRLDIAPDQKVLVLELDVNPPRAVPSYQTELRGPADRLVYSRSVKAPRPGAPLHLLVPTRHLSAGSYTLIVTTEPGGPGAWSSSYRFAVNKE